MYFPKHDLHFCVNCILGCDAKVECMQLVVWEQNPMRVLYACVKQFHVPLFSIVFIVIKCKKPFLLDVMQSKNKIDIRYLLQWCNLLF